jgi:hypothetical protein
MIEIVGELPGMPRHKLLAVGHSLASIERPLIHLVRAIGERLFVSAPSRNLLECNPYPYERGLEPDRTPAVRQGSEKFAASLPNGAAGRLRWYNTRQCPEHATRKTTR